MDGLVSLVEKAEAMVRSHRPHYAILPPGRFCDRPGWLTVSTPETQAVLSSMILDADLCKPERFLERSIDASSLGNEELAILSASLSITYATQARTSAAYYAHHLSMLFRQRHDRTQLIGDLNDAVYFAEKTLEYSKPGDSSYKSCVGSLATLLLTRYLERPADDELHTANRYMNELIGTAGDIKLKAATLHNKAVLLNAWIKNKGIVSEKRIDEVIGLFKESMRIMMLVAEPSLVLLSETARSIGFAYRDRYELSHSVDDADLCMDSLMSVRAKSDRGSRPWLSATEAGSRCALRFWRDTSIARFESQTAGLLRDLVRENHKPTESKGRLASFLRELAENSDTKDMLDESIELSEDTIVATSDDSPIMPWLLYNCGSALKHRFEAGGNLNDLETSVEVLEVAFSRSLDSPDDLCGFGEVLCSAYLLLFDTTASFHALERASVISDQLLENMGDKKMQMASCLRESAKVQFRKWRSQVDSYDTSSMDLAIERYVKAISMLGTRGHQLPVFLNELGHVYSVRFHQFGRMPDFQKTVEAYEEALSSLRGRYPDRQHPDEAMIQLSLSNVKMNAFQHWGGDADLRSAIRLLDKCVRATDSDHARYLGRLGSLAAALRTQALKVGDASRLPDIAQKLQIALDNRLDLPGHDRVAILNDLGNLWDAMAMPRPNVETDMAKLCQAIAFFNAALLIPDVMPRQRIMPARNLAWALLKKASSAKQPDDCWRALRHVVCLLRFEENNKLPIENTVYIKSLVLEVLWKLRQNSARNRVVAHSFATYADLPGAAPMLRVHALSMVVQLGLSRSDTSNETADAISKIIIALPTAVSPALSRAEQMWIIEQFSYLPGLCLAASIAHRDSAALGLHRFEQTRAFFWSRLIDQNTELDRLEAEGHGSFAQRFKTLTRELAVVAPSRSKPSLDDIPPTRKHALAAEYSEVVQRIRSIPGFASFLELPKEDAKLESQVPSNSYVIVLNGNEHQSGAIVVSSTDIKLLSLPALTKEACSAQLAEYEAALACLVTDVGRSAEALVNVLGWLWTSAAKPVLEAAGICCSQYPNPKSRHKPRVWWILSGWMAPFPLHAAGDLAGTQPSSPHEPVAVHDCVVSSYLPTFRTLGHVRGRAAAFQAPKTGLRSLVVCMSQTPDRTPLEHAAQEAARVCDRLRASSVHVDLMDKKPMQCSVLEGLAPCNIAHMICHGEADARDASKSKLLLQDWRQSPLDVRTLLRSSLDHCQLAYLSACETAQNKAGKLPEESLHLAGGFVAAGVPYCVGTWWKVEDKMAVAVAEDFYDGIIDHVEKTVSFSRSAAALDDAIGRLRQAGASPIYWAAYCHFGA